MHAAFPHSHTWLIPLLLAVALSACGPRNLKERTRHGEKLSDEASSLLDDAEQSLRKLEPERAEEQLAEVKELVAQPDIELSPESEMLRSRLAELQAQVVPARKERERRELDAAVEKQRDEILRAQEALNTALEALERKDAGPAQAEAVLAAVERTQARLREGKSLESRSEDYAASVRRTEQRLTQATARAQFAQQVFAYTAGPVASRLEAEALEKKARAEKEPDAQLTLYTDARERFRRCGEASQQLISKTPELERTAIQVDGRATTPKAVGSGCTAKVDSLQRTVTKLEKARAAREKKRAAKAKAKG
ncbi:MAG TPA: hypothetical protein VK539_13445 [Myxococcaceae bacterium]|nr:hypothetical protein [Myxococcaceae bacterium]